SRCGGAEPHGELARVRRASPEPEAAGGRRGDRASGRGVNRKFVGALAGAAVSGFIALSYEILWYRVVAFASWGLPGAFGLLLGAYLFGLAVGSRIAGYFCKDDVAYGDPQQLRAIAAFALVANVVAWLVVPFFGWSAKKWDWPPALAMVALAAALLGAI